MSSPASDPSTNYIESAKSDKAIKYSGSLYGSTVTFFFNYESETFLFEANAQGADIKMAGSIKDLGGNKIEMTPTWGINTNSNGELVDTAGEEVITVDLSGGTFDFEGSKLTKV